MLKRMLIGTAAMLTIASSATAQDRGTVEFGGFGSYTMFDDDMGLENAMGWGGRVGVFLTPRWFMEFEGGASKAPRNGGLSDVNVGLLSARLATVPVKIGGLDIILGGGFDHADTETLESYGIHALAGARLDLNDYLALRGDYVLSYLNNGKFNNSSIRVGISMFRHPQGRETVVTRTVAGPAPMQRPDSVSAAETARLRASDAALRSLRDSLSRNQPTAMTPSNVAALATMLEMINFERDRADLDDVSRAILRDKVAIFKANPQMKIVITGYTSAPGTSTYNMALGLRRAAAAKAYLVSQGVAEDRIEISTRGENNLLVEGPSEVANEANRRGQFRLLIADPYLNAPRP